MSDAPNLIVNEVVEAEASWREIEMVSSPAFRALNKCAHQALARIEIAIADGRPRLGHDDFIGFGITRGVVTYAIRELEALGLVDVLRDPPHASQFSMSRRCRAITTFRASRRDQGTRTEFRNLSKAEAQAVARSLGQEFVSAEHCAVNCARRQRSVETRSLFVR